MGVKKPWKGCTMAETDIHENCKNRPPCEEWKEKQEYGRWTVEGVFSFVKSFSEKA